MTLKSNGVAWFRGHFAELLGPIHVSRYYPPEKSWTKQAAWAFEIPSREITGKGLPDIFLVYQVADAQQKFGCLRIPSSFLHVRKHQLYVRPDNGYISLFLSAEPHERLLEKRGSGGIDFGAFELIRRSQAD